MLKENYFTLYYNNISDLVFLVEVGTDKSYRFLSANRSYLAAAGYTEEQVAGKRIEEIYTKRTAGLLIKKFNEAVESGKTICFEEIADFPRGKLILQTKITPVRDNKGYCTHLLWTARDNTERYSLTAIEQAMKHRIALEGAIAQSSRLFVSPENADPDKVLKILGESVPANRAYIFRFRDNGSKMDNVYEWCSPGTECQIDNLQDLDSNIFPWWLEKLRRGENIVIPDVDALPAIAAAEKEILQAQKIRSLLVVPIYSTDGKLSGFMGFDDTTKCREWSGEDIKDLRVVAEMVGVYWDRRRAERALKETNQLLEQIIESLPDATLVIDRNKKVIAWNRAMEEMTGVSKEAIIGKGDYVYAEPFYGSKRPILIDLIFSENRENEQLYAFIERKGKALYTESFTPALYKGMGAFMWATASPLFDSEDNIIGAIESVRDITERKRMEERLQYLATHDALTNIPNRNYLEETLKRATSKAKRGKKSALLVIDLDNFKLINDTLGHAAGDELLIALAGVFKRNLRESDILARLGGDEFGVLLEGISAEEAASIAERLRQAVCESELCLVTHKLCLNLSVSIGIVIIDGTVDIHKSLSFADIALYAAKESGKNRVVFARPDEDMGDRLTETNRLIGLIKSALQEELFELNFQPVVSVVDRTLIHHETLIRLRDKNGQVILPGKFIPVAEHFGLMSQIDRWVVQSALKAMREFPELKLFINISGVTLGDEAILDEIEAYIRDSGIEPSRIGFEITETSAVKDLLRAERWIRRLKNLGCLFALDDFGTGFSSFSYLRILPVDYIKIDGSFVYNVDKEPVHRALIQAIHTIANTLGKKTIAEFVENENVLRVLQTIGIDFGQGYFLGEPDYYPR